MSTGSNYFFIDGSALTAQVRQIRRQFPLFKTRKLCPKAFVNYLMQFLFELHGGSYKRATFYFPVGDEVSISEHLHIPDFRRPGENRDIHFKFCGQKLKKSAQFEKFLETVPPEFLDRFNKSEKGIDVEICCDAFRLASAARVDRLFLLTNDDDFIPFCRMIKEYGCNISLVHLSARINPNNSLLKEVDSYDVVPLDHLEQVFPEISEQEDLQNLFGESAILSDTALKAEAEPSNASQGSQTIDDSP